MEPTPALPSAARPHQPAGPDGPDGIVRVSVAIGRSARLWWAVAAGNARQHVAYRATVVASIVSNITITVLRGHLALAVWAERPGLAGYDATAAVTYVVVGQALVTFLAVFGGVIAIPWRVEDGDIVMDLVRPVGFHRWWLGAEIGRAWAFLLSRALPAMAVGVALFDLALPASPQVAGYFGLSVMLALLISFGIRYLVALSAFWLTDVRGVQAVASLVSLFFSGAVLPLALFPGAFGQVARALPFAGTVQLPMGVYLRGAGAPAPLAALGLQAFWVIALFGLGHLVTTASLRRLVVQGG